MRLAILSDIHGNIAALDAVLADVAARGVDAIVNLGDILSGPLFPVETADRLMALDLPTIRGNHERQLLEDAPDRMGASDLFAAERLRPDQKAWIAALPATRRVAHDVLMVHGTPENDLAPFLESITPQGMRPATAEEVAARASVESAKAARMILCGHTHLPRMARLADGRLVVNPGSVGLPAYAEDQPFPHRAETGSPHARYAIAEGKDGEWAAEPLSVRYDWEGAARAAEAQGRADWARALRTGYA
ncbi:metallophosphoesterase family protein [Sphingopyxis sp. MWB1]|uniref:metallophosphoesterase family protein n=1 Tax=Sphingopyxis sp. MWB1 TaxID=1537715 RepID=UPI00051A2B4D|nr:metallophosphoesterase family protein [Sphingopyxis sp. MWB1]